MYNRYIPQHDGSFRRSRVSEPPVPPPKVPFREAAQEVCPETESCNCVREKPDCRQCQPCSSPRPIPSKPKVPPVSIGNFLKQLIPAGFDTEDLIVVLLLLLMAGDCKEDSNTALLTLVLYLFL